jgi:dipeptidase E
MRLYLSSYRLEYNEDDLGCLVSGQKRIGVIRNALDFSNEHERLREGREREFLELRKLGLFPEEIDLREYFDAPEDLGGAVGKFDALWVVGGNTFVLRRAFQQSGLDAILLEKVRDEQFVYAGYSAGICVVSPTLRGIDLVDDPEVIPEGYSNQIIWDGLGLVPFSFAPHYRSDHPESELVEKSVEFFIENKIPFIALHDGDVYVEDLKKPP